MHDAMTLGQPLKAVWQSAGAWRPPYCDCATRVAAGKMTAPRRVGVWMGGGWDRRGGRVDEGGWGPTAGAYGSSPQSRQSRHQARANRRRR